MDETPHTELTVGVVGLGYVGLPLVVAFAEAGATVIAVDTDARKISCIREGESYIEDVDSARLRSLTSRIEATSRYAKLARADAVIICVPTPLSANREPDLGALVRATAGVRDVLQAGQLVVVESTTYPGTTRERVVPLLEESGLAAGRDFNVAFSPERVDPGRTDYTMRTTPKVVGGYTEQCLERAVSLYETIVDRVVPVASTDAAELTKLFENIFRSVNIALVNELAMLAERLHIDIWDVIDAASTKPYGFMRFEPGPGMGGHCLPVDPFYLTWKAREVDFATEFIELAGKINQQMPYHCLDRVQEALNRVERSINGARIALLGVSYKTGVGDTRESPALKLLDLLQERGADVVYHDEFVPTLSQYGLDSQDLSETIAGADLVVIVTVHPGVDYTRVVNEASVVLDLRGVTRGLKAANVVRL